jgi:hypothetical protein
MPITRQVTDDPETWANSLEDNYLLCRDWGHGWRAYTALWDNKMKIFKRSLRCPRCKTIRHQELSQQGVVVGSYYEYADGYLAPAGIGRLTKDVRSYLRLESVQRMVSKEAS